MPPYGFRGNPWGVPGGKAPRRSMDLAGHKI